MAASIAHLPEKPKERDHNKPQFAVVPLALQCGGVWTRFRLHQRSGSERRQKLYT
jgi:hypothetical protein